MIHQYTAYCISFRDEARAMKLRKCKFQSRTKQSTATEKLENKQTKIISIAKYVNAFTHSLKCQMQCASHWIWVAGNKESASWRLLPWIYFRSIVSFYHARWYQEKWWKKSDLATNFSGHSKVISYTRRQSVRRPISCTPHTVSQLISAMDSTTAAGHAYIFSCQIILIGIFARWKTPKPHKMRGHDASVGPESAVEHLRIK